MLDRIGETVRTVRTRAGRSLEDLSARSGVPVATIEALEQGARGISRSQLDDVAEALSLDPVALLQGREVARCVPSVFLRHQGSMQDFDERDLPLLDDALDQGRILAALRKLVGDPSAAVQAETFRARPAGAHQSDSPAHEGHQLARQVRAWLGNATEPLGDLRALTEERFGVAVVVRRLESKGVTAVCVRAEDAAAIVLEDRDPQRAQNPLLGRVYLAHELCHALFDPCAGGAHVVVDFVLDRKAHQAEQRARAFAAELLLPLQGMKQMIDAPSAIREPYAALELIGRVRSRFGTPHAIAANHLCNQNLIHADLREWLEGASSTFAGEPPAMTLPSVGAPSPLVGQLAKRAHDDGLVTDGEARGMLSLDNLAPLPWETEL